MGALLGSRDENITKRGKDLSIQVGSNNREDQGFIGRAVAFLPNRAEQCAWSTQIFPLLGGTQLLESTGTAAPLGDTSLCMDCDGIHCFCKVGQGLGCLSAHSTPPPPPAQLGRGVACVHGLSGGCCFLSVGREQPKKAVDAPYVNENAVGSGQCPSFWVPSLRPVPACQFE